MEPTSEPTMVPTDGRVPLDEAIQSVDRKKISAAWKLEIRSAWPYKPCPCGSGKKYKWCCRPRDLVNAAVW